MTRLGAIALAVSLAARVPATAAGGTASIDPRVRAFRLPNGLQIIVAVRPELRLVALNLTVNVGAIDDPPGRSGIAHLLEHVTLSGSTAIGSLDPEAEGAALRVLDRAYAALESERSKQEPSSTVLVGLERLFEDSQRAAQLTCESGEILGGRLEAQGAVGLNATTTVDTTHFFTWMPAAHLELWISLEADRLRRPVLRRFYGERNVVLREIAALTRGTPMPQERFVQEIFGLPQAQSLAGDPQQVAAIDRPTALEHFRRYYRPENVVVGVVGNVDPDEVHRLCARYFGDWRPGSENATDSLPIPPRRTAPTQPRIKVMGSARSPLVFIALPRPVGADSAAVDAVAELINSEDLSLLRRRLVEQQSLAWNVGAAAEYPSQKQPSVFLLRVYGNPGVPHQRLVQETLSLLKEVDAGADEDIEGAIRAAELRVAAQLDDAPTLAAMLANSQAMYGDWSRPFQHFEALRRLRARDVREAARQLFQGLPRQAESTADDGR